MSDTAIKPMINGIEVKVGQVWEDGYGDEQVVLSLTHTELYPILTKNGSHCFDGKYYSDNEGSRNDLVKLIKDVEVPTLTPYKQAEQNLKQELGKLNDNLSAVYNDCKNSANNQDKKHSHYFKDVSHLETIDVYRVLQLYNVTNACQQHAAKKVLLAGCRGGKDYLKDIQEAIDTLERLKVMLKEDERNSSETKE